VKTQLLIPAAGLGVRLGAEGPKALVPLAGKPMLAHTLERFRPLGLIPAAIVLIAPEHRALFETALDAAFPGMALRLVPGGAERQESVANGLAALDADTEIVVIHDAARPFVATASIQASIEAAAEFGAATVAIPSVDTILEGDADAFLTATPDRTRLWACQTPQTFRTEVIREAHRRARADGFLGTDDASLVRRIGGPVKLVHGTRLNMKLTTPDDRRLAELIAGGQFV
jgi:2-C-methyl-D-erythritol 4-phosphate cytidylyltransferase